MSGPYTVTEPDDATPDNVVSLDAARTKQQDGAFLTVQDVGDLLAWVRAWGGPLELAILPPPDGVTAWVIESPEQVEQLGVTLIQHAQRMRGNGGPP